VHEQLVWLRLVGTVVSGVGFGAAFSGAMRTMLPLAKTDERAELLAAFYVEGCLSFSLPAVLTGLAVPTMGLTVAAYAYGAAVIITALASTIVVSFSRALGLSALQVAERTPAFQPDSWFRTPAGSRPQV
jgi:hypothetical protein